MRIIFELTGRHTMGRKNASRDWHPFPRYFSKRIGEGEDYRQAFIGYKKIGICEPRVLVGLNFFLFFIKISMRAQPSKIDPNTRITLGPTTHYGYKQHE